MICYIAMENGNLWWMFPLDMVIFYSYVKLPERKLMAILGTLIMEVTAMCKACFPGLCPGISPQNMARKIGTVPYTKLLKSGHRNSESSQ